MTAEEPEPTDIDQPAADASAGIDCVAVGTGYAGLIGMFLQYKNLAARERVSVRRECAAALLRAAKREERRLLSRGAQ